ncbi:disulfide bond formation protein B [Sulfitobacter sp. 1A13353]|uniref:disulfide bond formation protein B n=1 Tax=Sulfitobacter sp. 1A13353 TaxID=3368568 RepID=UPI003746C597
MIWAGRTFNRKRLSLLAGLGSASLLLGALGFEHIGGYAPCTFCLWQRWPHLLAVILMLISIRLRQPWVYILGALATFTSAGIGVFHTGVERGFWKGLQSCSGNVDLTNVSPERALEIIMTAKVVKCDEVAWQMAGLSMASWNAILSSLLAALWIKAYFTRDNQPTGGI